MKKSYKTEYINEHNEPCVLIATVRYDDECKNGHNTFAITGELYDRTKYVRGEPSTVHTATRKKLWLGSCGCIHEEIAAHLPELAPFIKWHHTSTDGPIYYVENTMYYAQAANLEAARSCAVWPDATLEQLRDKSALSARLPGLMVEFRAAVEYFGFTY